MKKLFGFILALPVLAIIAGIYVEVPSTSMVASIIEQPIVSKSSPTTQNPSDAVFELEHTAHLLLQENKPSEAEPIIKNLSQSRESTQLLLQELNIKQSIYSLATQQPFSAFHRALGFIGLNEFELAKTALLVAKETEPVRKQAAIGILENITTWQENPNTPVSFVQTLLAKTLNALNYPQLAIHLATQSIELHPEYRDAWIVLGYAQTTLREYSQAQRSLMKAYDIDSTKAEIQYLLGIVYNKRNKPNESITYLNYSLKNNFSHRHDIYEIMAENYILKEEYATAEMYWKKRLALPMLTPEKFVRPIWLYLEKLQYGEKARLLAHEANGKFPDSAVPKSLLAWIELYSGNLNLALQYLTQAQLLDPNNASIYLDFGKAYQAKGDNEQAKQYYTYAMETDPGSKEADEARKLYNLLISPF